MDYIVFDLEWNQNPNERARPNKLLPFEIIEIGAVRLDENRNILDTFHAINYIISIYPFQQTPYFKAARIALSENLQMRQKSLFSP